MARVRVILEGEVSDDFATQSGFYMGGTSNYIKKSESHVKSVEEIRPEVRRNQVWSTGFWNYMVTKNDGMGINWGTQDSENLRFIPGDYTVKDFFEAHPSAKLTQDKPGGNTTYV